MQEHERDMELENFPAVEALIRYIRENQPQTQILNLGRYYEMLIAREALKDLLRQSGEPAEVTVKFFPAFSCASLAVEVECFEICDKAAFAVLMRSADNFEVVPLTNEKLRIAFVFQRMMTSMVQ